MKQNLKKTHQKLWKLLLLVKKLLDRNKIPYWIESGTLLGFIRDRSFTEDAQNVNIGIPAEYIEKFNKIGQYSILFFRIKKSYDRSGVQWIGGNVCNYYTKPIFHLKTKNAPVFITPRHIVGEKARWIDSYNGRVCKEVPAHFYKKFRTETIKGISFPIPAEAEKYLTCRYGDWKKPQSNWSTNKDDKAIIDKDAIKKLAPKTRKADRVVKEKYFSKMSLIGKDLSLAKRMLEDTVTILERNNIPYWVDAGTLLGIIRDKELIPWDYDMDISVSSEYIQQVLALKKQFFPRYRLVTRFENSGRLPGNYRSCKVKLTMGKLYFFKKQEELHLDIFFKYKVDNTYCWIDSNITKRVDARFHDKLDTVEWNGKKYSIPSHVEDYLVIRYGDWRTPKKDYDASVDDNSIY